MILITRNEKKIEEFRLLLGDVFEVMQVEYPEIKADEPCAVAISAARVLSDKLQKEVIVEDSGLFIDALSGFPGTNTRFSDERIGNQGLLTLMQGIKDRKCAYKSAIGYCKPREEPKCFLGIEEGKIAATLRGTKGWGQDPIFIPKGSRRTYGESRKPGDVNIFRKRAADKLKEFLKL